MSNKFKELLLMNDSTEQEIWENYLFVFDTSALLELYFYSIKAQDELLDEIFPQLKGKLWITDHIEYEYLKNREKTSKKPYVEKYESINNDFIGGIDKSINTIQRKMKDFSNKTKNIDKHPHVNIDITNSFNEKVDKFFDEFSIFKDQIKTEFTQRKTDIERYSAEDSDEIFKRIKKIFKVGKKYDFKSKMKITQEGELRKRLKIAPGFNDDFKEGLQQFGDLIIWKQIIDLAKENNQSVIFITNDIKKGDWCDLDEKGDRIKNPKEELFDEMYDEVGKCFWMYSFSQFIYFVNEKTEHKLTKEVIEEIEEVSKEVSKEEELTISQISNRKLKEELIKVINELRHLLNNYQASQRIIFNENHNSDSYIDSLKVMNIYEKDYKMKVIVLKNETLKRMPHLRDLINDTDDYVLDDFRYLHPTNPLGIVSIVDSLEFMMLNFKGGFLF